MFICNECLKKFDNEPGWSRSNGRCEICGEDRNCSDIPSRYLNRKPEPIPPTPPLS